MAQQRIGGTIFLKRNGKLLRVKSGVTYSLGKQMRETQMAADGPAGYIEKWSEPYIEATIIDTEDLDLEELQAADDDTITLEEVTGKVVVLRNAWAAGEWVKNTETGEISARWVGMSASVVKA